MPTEKPIQLLIDHSSRLLLCSMFPLMLGIDLDLYVIAGMILSDAAGGGLDTLCCL